MLRLTASSNTAIMSESGYESESDDHSVVSKNYTSSSHGLGRRAARDELVRNNPTRQEQMRLREAAILSYFMKQQESTTATSLNRPSLRQACGNLAPLPPTRTGGIRNDGHQNEAIVFAAPMSKQESDKRWQTKTDVMKKRDDAGDRIFIRRNGRGARNG